MQSYPWRTGNPNIFSFRSVLFPIKPVIYLHYSTQARRCEASGSSLQNAPTTAYSLISYSPRTLIPQMQIKLLLSSAGPKHEYRLRRSMSPVNDGRLDSLLHYTLQPGCIANVWAFHAMNLRTTWEKCNKYRSTSTNKKCKKWPGFFSLICTDVLGNLLLLYNNNGGGGIITIMRVSQGQHKQVYG